MVRRALCACRTFLFYAWASARFDAQRPARPTVATEVVVCLLVIAVVDFA